MGTILLPTISRQLGSGNDADAMATQNRGARACAVPDPARDRCIGRFAAFRSSPACFSTASSPHWTRSEAVRRSPPSRLGSLLHPREGADARLLRAPDTRTPMRFAMISIAINLALNLAFIVPAQACRARRSPPRSRRPSTSGCSTARSRSAATSRPMLAFAAGPAPRRRVAHHGGGLYFLTPLIDPYLTGSILRRAWRPGCAGRRGRRVYACRLLRRRERSCSTTSSSSSSATAAQA